MSTVPELTSAAAVHTYCQQLVTAIFLSTVPSAICPVSKQQLQDTSACTAQEQHASNHLPLLDGYCQAEATDWIARTAQRQRHAMRSSCSAAR
jgi:hypothetical protein